MTTTPNPYLIRFSDTIAPSEWKSSQAKCLYDAGIAAERDGSWASHAVSGTVLVASRPTEPSMSTYGTLPEVARAHVEREIDALRARAKRIEKQLRAYGPSAFIELLEPQRAPRHPFEIEPFLTGILSGNWTRIEISGRVFLRDAHRSASSPVNQ
jgi:hypothetical protein